MVPPWVLYGPEGRIAVPDCVDPIWLRLFILSGEPRSRQREMKAPWGTDRAPLMSNDQPYSLSATPSVRLFAPHPAELWKFATMPPGGTSSSHACRTSSLNRMSPTGRKSSRCRVCGGR